MKNVIFLILAVTLLAYTSCKKDDNTSSSSQKELPDAHNPDALSVFGCKVNGEVWTPGGTLNSLSYTYHEPTGGFYLTAKKKKQNLIWQEIVLNVDFFNEGTYFDGDSLPYFDAIFCYDNPEYALDTTVNYFVKIEEFSKTDGVIIGRFEFTAISTDSICPNTPDTIRITDGRFKATYK